LNIAIVILTAFPFPQHH